MLRSAARAFAVLAALLLLLAAAACPFAGRYLIVEMPLDKADVLVVLAGGNASRWLEATDLYREGYAPHVLLSPGYSDPVGDQLRARGIRFPTDVEIVRDVMTQVGVPASALEIMPRGYDNTADEAVGARIIAQQKGWTRMIVVTSQYHTRRSLFAFERELRGTGISVQIQGSRYEQPQPDGWWRSRSDLRWVLSETQRLIAYRLGLSN